jgi:hypothetical protein
VGSKQGNLSHTHGDGDGADLLIIAPGLQRFGEQESVDRVIRKYGYRGTTQTLQQYKENSDLGELAHAAAHLIHGSSEGRFTISYAPGHLTKNEIEQVNYRYMPLNEARAKYPPGEMKESWNITPDGEEVFFISMPSSGLWATQSRLDARSD